MIRTLALALSVTACAAAPTFTRDVAPIIFENCSGCHRPGQSGPFSLLTYSDVSKRAKQIAEITAKREMPPWLPDPAYGHFEGERILGEKQIRTLTEWSAGGAPEGNPSELPKLPVWREGWTLGKPDLVIKTPVFNVPAEGKDVYRNFVVPIPSTGTQYVAGVEFDPGNRSVSHHAFLMIDRSRNSRWIDERDPLPGFEGMDIPPTAMSPDGHFLSWQPGKRFSLNPSGLSWRLYPNSDLVLQTHLQLSGKAETLESSVAFYFTNQPPTRIPLKIGLSSYDIDIPAGETNYVVTDSLTLPIDVEVLGVLPHAHYLGKDLQGFVKTANGRTNWLIRIPNWNFNWQGDYRLKTPVLATAGSVLTMRYSYDNSTNNPRNPHAPPVRVRYGVQTVDEMGELWVQVLPKNPAELPALRQAIEVRVLQKAMDFANYRLRIDPNDPKGHVKMAQALLAQGKRREAFPHLRTAVDADPNNDDARYYLGLIARMEGRNEFALQEFGEAIRINPRYAKAFGNLGLVHFELGNLPAAETNFLKAVELEPADAIAHDTLGVIYLRQRKLAEAEKHFREAAKLQPDDASIQSHLKILETAKKSLQK